MTTQPNPLLPTEDQPSQRRPAPVSPRHDAPPPRAAGLNKLVSFELNGRQVSTMVDVRENLTDFLRNEFGLTSIKKGCEVGECGACTVLVDGKAMDSCIYLAVWVDGKKVLTTEGLASESGLLSDVQQAFVDTTAVQCGFCTPGLLMTATELTGTGRQYTRDELRKRLAGHLCRCTGYENILNAVELALQKSETRAAAQDDEKFWDTISSL